MEHVVGRAVEVEDLVGAHRVARAVQSAAHVARAHAVRRGGGALLLLLLTFFAFLALDHLLVGRALLVVVAVLVLELEVGVRVLLDRRALALAHGAQICRVAQ